VLRNAEHIPVIAPNQLFKRPNITVFGGLDESQFVADGWVAYLGLDGAHFLSDATIFAPQGADLLFYLVSIPLA
jgi:hypothetical protein